MVLDHVHISHVSKTGNLIPSCGFQAGTTCRPDAPCYKECYARKGRFAFNHNKNLLAKNLAIWKEDHDFFRREIIIAAFPEKFFRWFPSGDIPDEAFYDMMCQVAREVPGTRFLAFTKKYELVNDYLNHHEEPENLKTVLSAWGDFTPDNPHNLPMAYVELKDQPCEIPEYARACPLYCGDCVYSHHSCWDLEHGEAVKFKQH